MKLLRHAPDAMTAHHWANVLNAAGIVCQVRNTVLTGALGEIPFLEAAPQLWVVDDWEASRANLILNEIEAQPAGAAWLCPQCGQECEAQFFNCWHCGQARDPSVVG